MRGHGQARFVGSVSRVVDAFRDVMVSFAPLERRYGQSIATFVGIAYRCRQPVSGVQEVR